MSTEPKTSMLETGPEYTTDLPAADEPAGGDHWSVADRVVAYLNKMPPSEGANGHREIRFRARVLTHGFDLGVDDTFDLLWSNYNPRCTPPMSESDLRQVCREAEAQPLDGQRGWAFKATDRQKAGTPAPPASAARHSGQSPPPMIGFSGPPEPLPTSMPVPPFPVDVFPPAVAEFINAASESLAAPPEYVAIPVLGVLSVSIGRSRQIQVKPNYFESASLYLANVATPGAKKSPSLSAAIAPLHEIERQWRDEFGRQMEAFDTESQRYSEEHKEWKRGGCEGDPPAKPVKPVCPQATIDDATAEAVARVLNDNERGVAVVKDELTAMIRSMNAYRGGKGADRELYLSAWSGAMIKVNRAKDHGSGPMIVPHPFVTVFGMLTPSSLAELRGDTKSGDVVADGFFERFLMSFPPPARAVPELWSSIPDDVLARYTSVVKNLMEVELREDGNGRRLPNVLFMGDDCRRGWEEFTGRMADAMNRLDEYDPERGTLSKLIGYAARLALLLWCAYRAAGEPGYGYAQQHLDQDTLSRAVRLVDYFAEHGRKAMGGGWKEKRQRLAERILRWLARHPEITAFTRSTVFIAIKDRRDVTKAEAVNEPLAMLVDHLFIRPMDPDGGRPGPKPEYYVVNPMWERSETTL